MVIFVQDGQQFTLPISERITALTIISIAKLSQLIAQTWTDRKIRAIMKRKSKISYLTHGQSLLWWSRSHGTRLINLWLMQRSSRPSRPIWQKLLLVFAHIPSFQFIVVIILELIHVCDLLSIRRYSIEAEWEPIQSNLPFADLIDDLRHSRSILCTLGVLKACLLIPKPFLTFL